MYTTPPPHAVTVTTGEARTILIRVHLCIRGCESVANEVSAAQVILLLIVSCLLSVLVQEPWGERGINAAVKYIPSYSKWAAVQAKCTTRKTLQALLYHVWL